MYTKMGRFNIQGVCNGQGHTILPEGAPDGSVKIPARKTLVNSNPLGINMEEVALLRKQMEQRIADLAPVTANSRLSK